MAWSSFIIGLIVGWLIELAIDYFYWRPKRICTDGERNLQASFDQLKAENEKLKASASNSDGGSARIDELEASIKAKDAEIGRLSGELTASADGLSGVASAGLGAVADATGMSFSANAPDVDAKIPSPDSKSELNVEDDSKRDDLTKIWGIGPKIAGVLNANDISTFDALAKTGADRIDNILTKAGSSFKLSGHELHESWTKQARLAAEDQWEDLQEFQSTIKRSGQH